MRCCRTSLLAAGLACVLGTAAQAAIIPHWRVNPINSFALNIAPVLTGAVSVSLLVDLTGNSLFNVAGMDLSPVLRSHGAVNIEYFNSVFGSNTPPNPIVFPLFPDVEFDTYVGTTDRSVTPGIPSPTHSTPVVGANGEFKVVWCATPNTGPLGGTNLEIARITILHAAQSGLFVDLTGGLPVPLANGRVRDNLSPNFDVPLPPIPLNVPEPKLGLAAAALSLLITRRQ